MNKKILLVLSVFLIFIMVACGKSEVVNNNVENIETTNNEFVVGFDAEYPPYGYMDAAGNYTGFDLELAEEVCKRNNFSLVKQPIDWDTKDLELNSGNIDCIWNGFTITGRENDYTWTFPYVDNQIVIVINNDSNINDLSNIKNLTTQAGSSAESTLNSLKEDSNSWVNNIEISLTADFNTAFMNLESGVTDAVAVDIGVAKYQLNNRKDLKIFNDGIDDKGILSSEQYAVGFKKGNTEYRDMVEKTLKDMFDDGTFMSIANKYLDYNLPYMICIDKYLK